MKQNEWISISDMMAGVMMIFLLITVSYMVTMQQREQELHQQNTKLESINTRIQKIARNYTDLQSELYHELAEEFKADLTKWNAVIQPDNTIRFKEPNVLFDPGESKVKDHFKMILDEFFPRYVEILSRPKYQPFIEEIRIEGHTSTKWQSADTFEERYLGNAFLSQGRAFRVLEYCFQKSEIKPHQEWLVTVLRANGLSFAKPLQDDNSSRRVEFRTIVHSHQGILEILDLSKEMEKSQVQNLTLEKETP